MKQIVSYERAKLVTGLRTTHTTVNTVPAYDSDLNYSAIASSSSIDNLLRKVERGCMTWTRAQWTREMQTRSSSLTAAAGMQLPDLD